MRLGVDEVCINSGMEWWCAMQDVEEDVKKRSSEGEGGSAKTLCMPFEQPDLPKGVFTGVNHIAHMGGGWDGR